MTKGRGARRHGARAALGASMGHDSFAYITTITDHSPDGLRRAFEDLRMDPPPSGPDAHTATGGYTISDKSSVRLVPQPLDLAPSELERVARAIIRNLNAPRVDFPANPFARREWDDAQARAFFFQHAGKWDPAVIMPLPGRRAFVFGMVGG
jgi:hypothetical protein